MFLTQQILHLVQNLFFITVGLLGIGFLIGFHELGHFVFCKLFRIRTPSFSIGMGPKIFSRKIGQTEFALSAIPLGGYVEIAGAAEVGQGDQKESASRDQHSFAVKPYWQKLLVMIGGILFNLGFAYIVFAVMFYFGMPKFPIIYAEHATTLITEIEPDSPAAKAGLLIGDKIVAVNTTVVNKAFDVFKFIKDKANTTQTFTIERNQQKIEIPIAISEKVIEKQGFAYLGITDFFIPRYSLVDSLMNAFEATNQIIKQVWLAFKGMFTARTFEGVGGPLMVISQTIKGAEKGVRIFLLLLAFISINLAMLNIIPLPIMDGGQILFYTIEAIIRRPLPEQIRIYIHYACWIAVLLLVIYLSIKDLLRIFGQ